MELNPIPDGCFPIHFEILKIQKYAEELSAHYDAYLERRAQANLDASEQAVHELNTRINNALTAIERLIREIQAVGSP